MNGANLTDADMSGANLDHVNAISLLGCPATLPVNWVCIASALVGPTANLTNANLTGANLSGFDLSGALLNGLDLTGTNISGANLSSAGLNGTNLTSADLDGANVTGANLSVVTWGGTICPDGTHSNSNGSSPESCCAHLNGMVPSTCSP